MRTILGLVSFFCFSFSFAEEVQPCRYELTKPQFFLMRLGEYPPKEDNMPNFADKLLKDLESFLEDYIGTSIVGAIKTGAFAASNTKYFAEMYVVYYYRFIHNNKPTTQWIKKQGKVSNGSVDYFTSGKQGVNDSRSAQDTKERDINNYLQEELNKECENHQN